LRSRRLLLLLRAESHSAYAPNAHSPVWICFQSSAAVACCRDMNTASNTLKVVVALVLTVLAFCVLTYLVALIYHRMFGTVGGNL
jgi:hypothetical protein